MKSITLYYREGTSDKVYACGVDPLDDGYVVSFHYGRRGGSMKAGLKTPAPVSLGEAVRVYNDLVAEKVAKGYVAGEDDAVQYTPPVKSAAAGALPGVQLLNPIEKDEVSPLVADAQWGVQPKIDGKRIMVRGARGAELDVRQRQGKPCNIASVVHDALQTVAQFGASDFIVDGEMVGNVYFVFDCLRFAGKDLTDHPYLTRYLTLKGLVKAVKSSAVVLVPLAETTREKADMIIELVKANAEGAVFKRLDARHTAGRPGSGGAQRKLKFWATLTGRVAAEPTGSRSVNVELMKKVGAKRAWVPVGSVSIPVNKDIPPVGALIEVRYLYAFPNGCIYQPVYLGIRDDVEEAACVTAQLKFKQGEVE